MHEFPHPKNRIRRVVEGALEGTTFVSSQSEDGGKAVVIQARRTDGAQVGVRFRGVRESETTAEPAPGSPLRVRKVGSGNKFSPLSFLLPILRPPGPAYARVTIEAGVSRIQIVCQDAEWWEEGVSSGQT
jgi:hypothetical protein